MTVSRTLWQNIQHYSWLVCGLVCLFMALVFWAVTDTDQLVQVDRTDIAETQTQIQPQKVTATANLGTLANEVKPLDLTMRVVTTSHHEPEFRGTKFMQENQKSWSIELFRSSDEDIIKNYLKSQANRKNFIYFRLSGENQQEQYVLAYGVFKHESEAKDQLAQLQLGLPVSVHPMAVSLSRYIPLVNDLGSEEIKGGTAQLYGVVLKNAPIPVAQPQPSAPVVTSSVSNATTTTTVIRRDPEGNVVDVRQSHNSVASPQTTPVLAPVENKPARPVENEVSDPFN